MKKIQYKKGLTLVELLVAIVAASIVILTVAVILIMAFRSWRINNAYVDMRRDAALAVYMMARDVREAKYSSLTDGNPLILPSAVANKTVTYTQVGETLKKDAMLVIPKNVQVFDSTKRDDGVLLSLKLANTALGIAITNEVFVNTRN